MVYRNKKTGAVVDVKSVLGGSWEPVEKKTEKKAAETGTKEKKGKAKK